MKRKRNGMKSIGRIDRGPWAESFITWLNVRIALQVAAKLAPCDMGFPWETLTKLSLFLYWKANCSFPMLH